MALGAYWRKNTATKLARHRNHLRFNLHCKHNGITPISLRLRTNVWGVQAENIIKRAERSLLGVRIGQTVGKVKKLSTKYEVLKADVDLRLPRKQQKVQAFVINAQMQEHRSTKERQQNKFQRLNEKKTAETQRKNNNIASECMTRWVKNCSDRILADPELSILKKGLKFAITPKRLPIVDIITATESACRSLKSGDANELRAKVVNIINKHEKIKDQNVSKEEWKAIENLKADD